MRWPRTPLLHFLAGGAALFWVVQRVAPARPAAADAPIVVSAADVANLRAAYIQETGLQPRPADEVALIDRTIEEELLFREAIARGLDRNDRSVRNWLLEQMRVLTDGAGDDEEALLAHARALELDRKDLVVRRMLVQKVRLLASRAGEDEVSDAALRAFYAAHQDDYRLPDRVAVWHIFLGTQRHGEDAARDAERLLAELRSGAVEPALAARRGDPFPLPPHLTGQSRQQLDKVFGARVADEILRGAEHTWLGPFASPYGAHLVWIEQRDAAAAPPFESVRKRVLQSWREQHRAERLAALIRDLKTGSQLLVDSPAWRQRRNA